MTTNELREVTNISSGTIANFLGTNSYDAVDHFNNWLWKPIIDGIPIGCLVAFGNNSFDGLRNSVSVYRLHERIYTA